MASTVMNIIEVTKDNVNELGFFCRMTKMDTKGNQLKLKWLEERFNEGLKIKMLNLSEGGRGFIEYIPGKYSWRAIDAPDYMVIHCLWVVGKSQKKGYGKLLLKECEKDAKAAGLKGVVMLTSEKPWLAGCKIFEKNGFKSAAEYPPAYNLMVKKFGTVKDPVFSCDFEKNVAKYKSGLTVIYANQCPYMDDAVNQIKEIADRKKIKFNAVELKSAKEVREKSVIPYGTFGVVYEGKVIGSYYMLPKDLEKVLGK